MPKLDHSLVADLPFFAALQPDQVEDVLAAARSLRVPKNKAVFEQGERADRFYLLLDGRLRVVRTTPDGRQVVVRFIAPGELFGVAMALRIGSYPGTAIAVTDSVALAWPNAVWPELVGKYPSLALDALQTVGGRLQEANTRILEMATEQVERRIAHALLRLARQAGRKTDRGVLIDFPISRQDIAEMTGTTLHTVSRTLSAWQDRGWIESGRQRVLLRKPHELVMLIEANEPE